MLLHFELKCLLPTLPFFRVCARLHGPPLSGRRINSFGNGSKAALSEYGVVMGSTIWLVLVVLRRLRRVLGFWLESWVGISQVDKHTLTASEPRLGHCFKTLSGNLVYLGVKGIHFPDKPGPDALPERDDAATRGLRRSQRDNTTTRRPLQVVVFVKAVQPISPSKGYLLL
jgi:hypothetical protein